MGTPAKPEAEALRARLAELNEEIRRYPQPIARCDAQLAGLVDERDRVREKLRSIEGHAR